MYEYDTMEVNCSQLMKNSKGDLKRYTTKSSEVLTVLVELYEMTYCSAPDGFYSDILIHRRDILILEHITLLHDFSLSFF